MVRVEHVRVKIITKDRKQSALIVFKDEAARKRMLKAIKDAEKKHGVAAGTLMVVD